MSSEVRLGNVSSIDYENGLCEVTYPDRDDTVTEMVPMLSNREYRMPEVDDLVVVLHPGDSPEDAVILGTIWNEKIKPVEGKEKVFRKEYSNEPILNVAIALGFDSQQSFNRSLRKCW